MVWIRKAERGLDWRMIYLNIIQISLDIVWKTSIRLFKVIQVQSKTEIQLVVNKKFIFDKCVCNNNIKVLSYWKILKMFDELSHIVSSNNYYGIGEMLRNKVIIFDEQLTIKNMISSKFINCSNSRP